MAHKSSSDFPSSLERGAIVVLGLYLAAVGSHALVAGQFLYRNYLHAQVMAPVSVVIGVVLIGAGLWTRD